MHSPTVVSKPDGDEFNKVNICSGVKGVTLVSDKGFFFASSVDRWLNLFFEIINILIIPRRSALFHHERALGYDYFIDTAGPYKVLCPAYKEPTAFHENPIIKNFFVFFACAQRLRVATRVQGVLIVVKKG